MSTNRILLQLPEDALLSIASFNTASELSKIAQVSRSLRAITNDKILQKQLSVAFKNLVPKVVLGLETAIYSSKFSMEINDVFRIGIQLIDTISNPPFYYLSGENRPKIQAIQGNAIVLIRNSNKAYFFKNNKFDIEGVDIELLKEQNQQLLEQKPTTSGLVTKNDENTALLTTIIDQVWRLSLAEKLEQLTLLLTGTLILGFMCDDSRRGSQEMFSNQLLYPYGSFNSLKKLGLILEGTILECIFQLGAAVLAHKIPFNWEAIHPEVFSLPKSYPGIRPSRIRNALTSIEQLKHLFNHFKLLTITGEVKAESKAVSFSQPPRARQAKPASHSSESKQIAAQITVPNEAISDVLKILRKYEKVWFKAQDRTTNVTKLIQDVLSSKIRESDVLLYIIDQAQADANYADQIANQSACFFNRNFTGSRYQKALEQARECVQRSALAV